MGHANPRSHRRSGEARMVWRFKLASDKRVRAAFINRYMRVFPPSVQKLRIRNLKPVYISDLGRKDENSTSLVVADSGLTVLESPNQDKIRAARRTVILSRSKSSVLVMFTKDNLQSIKPKLQTRESEQIIVAIGVSITQPLVPPYFLVTNFWKKNGASSVKDGNCTWRRVSNIKSASQQTI